MDERDCRICWGHALCVALLVLLSPTAGHAHALLHDVVEGEAVILRFTFPDAQVVGFEPYEVLAPGVEIPFQSGRVNALGEISFRPDRPGTWRVRLFTADGHGAEIDLEVDEAGNVAPLGHHGGPHDYWLRVLAALGYLLGAFGLLVLWRARRARAGPG